MEKTKLRRRQWIRTEEAMASETVKKYPCLASIHLVSLNTRLYRNTFVIFLR